jgi:integrase
VKQVGKSNTGIQVAIPSRALTPDGIEFHPSTLRWRLSRDVMISLQWIDELLDEPLKTGFCKTLLHYAENYAAGSTARMACDMRLLLSPTSRPEGRHSLVTPYLLINYKATLDRTTEFHLGTLKSFFKLWNELGYGGIDPAIIRLMKGWRFRGQMKGVAVQMGCPLKGALSDLEFEALQRSLVDALEAGEIALDDFVLVALFMATGRRPCQIADLKGSDLLVVEANDGLREFVLMVPRRKQRGGKWRTELKPVALTPEIGMAVERLLRENEARLLEFSSELPLPFLKLLPIFPSWWSLARASNQASIVSPRMMEGQDLHVSTQHLKNRVGKVIASLSVPSERIGRLTWVTPLRLRRTTGTRAAREGYGVLVIAELLDHTDIQSAGIYTENVPEHIDAINKAVARQLAPLAQAFAGVLVDSESQAMRGSDFASRIRTDGGPGVGTCGRHGFCGAYAPIACYTCSEFQPWLDGAHEEVLEALNSEYIRILDVTRDPVMAAINNRTIFAVTEVILRCDARRAELKQGRHIG